MRFPADGERPPRPRSMAVVAHSPPLKPLPGTSWTSHFHHWWAKPQHNAPTSTPSRPAPLAILEDHETDLASNAESDLKVENALEQATELLYEAQVRLSFFMLLFSLEARAQDDIISHDYAAALHKLERAAKLGSSAACAYLAKYVFSRSVL